ncbi:MAG: outer membrane beta-barrel protein [Xanthobacteraceae bacterium]
MPRRRHAYLAPTLAFGAGIAAVLMTAADANAQMPPDPSYRILRPAIDGSVNNSPQLRKPAGASDSADSVPIGQIPVFGHPPAFGAGQTGFVSTGARRRKPKPKPGEPRAQPGVGTSQLGPAALPSPSRAARRANRASTRIGGVPTPGGVGGDSLPPVPRRRPSPEPDPFDPVGMRVGSFLMRSAVELTGGADTNPSRAYGGSAASALFVVAPEMQLRSDWNRHALDVDLRGSYTWLASVPSLDRPNLEAKANGRIDVTSQDHIDLQSRFLLSTDYPGSPNLQAGIAKLPIFTSVGATAGYDHTFNRLDISLKGTVDRTTYQESLLTDGTTFSNSDRNYDQYGAQLRGSYELNPGLKPFAELDVDRREHDLPFDRSGLQRDSDGITPRVGAKLDLAGELRGELSVGYTDRTYKDPSFQDLRGMVVDGSMVWSPTGLTSATLTAQSFANESVLTGVSGVLTQNYAIQVDHAFRRWLIGTAKLGFGTDDYVTSPRLDHRTLASLGVTYKIDRNMQIKGEVRREWLHSNIAGSDYTANVFLAGIRLQN